MKKNKGITLIALVITIIILIILAGVSISVLFNQDGIITKAKKAKEDYANAQNEEAKTIGTLINSIDGNINEETGSTSSELKDWEYTTTNDGKIILSKYIGTNPEVIVKEKYKVNDKQYSTVMKKTNYSVTTIVGGPFINNTIIEKVIFENAVAYEENSMEYAFYGCEKLREINIIPIDVTNMKCTFYNCTSLKNIPSLPNNVTNLEAAFGYTKITESPKIPEGVTNLNSTFAYTPIIESPTIPSSVKNMNYTFKDYLCKRRFFKRNRIGIYNEI